MIKWNVKRNIIITTVGLMVSNFLVKFFGFMREVLLANYYGTSIYTDAYVIANNIPTVLFSAIGASIATTFIPMYSQITQKEGEQRANVFTWHLLRVLLIICLIFTICGELFIRQFVLMFASGFVGELLELTILFARILFPTIFSLALMNVLGAYLQQHGKFMIIALVPLFGNGVIITALILSQYFHNIFIMIWGTLLGSFAQLFFYIPWVIREGILKTVNVTLIEDKYIFGLLKLVIPVFLGEAVNEINTIIDKSLVSGLGTGSVSALNYAYKIIGLITSVFVVSINCILFPQISMQVAKGKMDELSENINQVLSEIFLLMLPIMALIILFRYEIIILIFQRGSFDNNSVRMTAGVLGVYAIGIVANGLRDVLVKLFYSLQETKIPMLNGGICAVVNIVLDILLIKIMGIYGAALATSLVAILGCLNLLYITVKRKLVNFRGIAQVFSKGIIGCLIMLFFAQFGKSFVDKWVVDFRNRIFADAIVGILGGGVFFFSQMVMGNMNTLKQYFRRQK